MITVLLIVHLMIALGLVVVVLLQRSEGGGLGLGGGGSSFMTGRGTADFLTRATMGLAAAFFVTSISLTLLASHSNRSISPLDLPGASKSGTSGGSSTKPSGGILDSLEKGKANQRLPSLPKSE
ncbi:MAG: preprotein translocase subunit SecG [Hyphomicrobiaceae bacterium]